jgi:hypothetical protein
VTLTHSVAAPRALTTMQPFFRELAVNRETSGVLLGALTPEQLEWRPAEGVWGLAEICSHLARITAVYLPALDVSIEQGQSEGAFSDRPFRASTLGRLVVWMMEPPVRLRLRSPRAMRPRPGIAPMDALQAYRASQHALELRLERAAGLDLTNVMLQPPTLRGLSISLGTAVALLLAHERRHLWQATAVRQSSEFPS